MGIVENKSLSNEGVFGMKEKQVISSSHIFGNG